MKTKFLKFILPAFAIMMAIGLAFASEAETVYQTAYYNHPALGWQSVTAEADCGAMGDIPCTFNGNQLYAQPSYNSTLLRKF